MERILLLLAAARVEDGAAAMESARAHAFADHRVSFGLSLLEEPSEEELALLRSLGACQFLTPAADPWLDFQELWQGESHVLVGTTEMRFARHWDLTLLKELRACAQESEGSGCALTGYLPLPQDAIAAVCPVAAEGFDENGRLCFHRGTPLRYAAGPQPCAFLHPRFCFAPVGFFQQVAHSQGPRFLAAFQLRWQLYTLSQPVLSLTTDMDLPPCPVEGEERVVKRFEKKFGLRLDTRQLSPVIRRGLVGTKTDFPVHYPLALRCQQAWHSLLSRTQQAQPMCATVYLRLPQPTPHLPEEYLQWFRYLSQIKALPLTCYAEEASLRQLTELCPNVLTYKQRYALPISRAITPEEALNYLQLSKPFLLAKTKEKFAHQTHYVWLDFGMLRYPVYPGAALNWDVLCQETICLSHVAGQPDGAMLVIPANLVEPVCQEIESLCQASLAANDTLPTEREVWLTLEENHPDWFSLVDLPGCRELFTLTMLSREEEFHVLA